MTTVTKTERDVLQLLHESRETLYTKYNIAVTLNVTRTVAARAVRSLVRRGFAEVQPAFNDDGQLVGSGYHITTLGGEQPWLTFEIAEEA